MIITNGESMKFVQEKGKTKVKRERKEIGPKACTISN